MTPDERLRLYANPPKAGLLACEVRSKIFGSTIEIRPTSELEARGAAMVLRGTESAVLDHWPEVAEIAPEDTVLLRTDASEDGRRRYCAWLDRVASVDVPWRLAPFSATPAGIHRLWCLAVARLALPERVRIEARHDLVGIRLAQLALGFGADTLSGPVQADRVLPLAGVTRPAEATLAGLCTLVRQAGLEPAPVSTESPTVSTPTARPTA